LTTAAEESVKTASQRDFQVFAKPVGARCNLRCEYCYYLPRGNAGPGFIPDDIVERYIVQHIQAAAGSEIRFSWHGGEPSLYGLDGFRRIRALQRKHCPNGCRIVNGIQTNGWLLDDAWCRFLAEEGFLVGLSLDGRASDHDRFRVTPRGAPTHARVMRAWERLRAHGAAVECLCVVHAENAGHPRELYDYFRGIGVRYLTFLPLVERSPDGGVSERSLSADAWGEFLCAIFDAWLDRDIGRIKIQIFEEAARTAFGLEHSLCIFRKTCGRVLVLESNGDLYSCDHFVAPQYRLGNIAESTLAVMLDGPRQQNFGRLKESSLPRQCLRCEVREMCNGGCPKNRFIRAADGEPGLNYLCAGYRRFFRHCRPFVETLREVWRQG
jgi:uncharacterized protein